MNAVHQANKGEGSKHKPIGMIIFEIISRSGAQIDLSLLRLITVFNNVHVFFLVTDTSNEQWEFSRIKESNIRNLLNCLLTLEKKMRLITLDYVNI